MNKQEKLFAALFALGLVGYFAWNSYFAPPPPPAPVRPVPVAPAVAAPSAQASSATAQEAPVIQPAVRAPEQRAVLATDELEVTVSSRGAVIKKAILPHYRQKPEADSPPVAFDFEQLPALALNGLPSVPSDADYTLKEVDAQTVELSVENAGGLRITRRIQLTPDYQITVKDIFSNTGSSALLLGANTLSTGALTAGLEESDVIAADTYSADERKATHWGDKLPGFFGVSSGFMGCGGAPSAQGLPLQVSRDVPGNQKWVAVKTRFFATVLMQDFPANGVRLTAHRDPKKPTLAVNCVSGEMSFAGETLQPGITLERNYTLYIGPKKLSVLQSLGAADVMEFGFFSWFCKLLVPTLNFFYGLIPNYGVAIILLTFLVRMLFWPLTHKSTVSMKKMQTIQPLMKELQAKYKDNPQKMQQETWALYREHKVNPLSSCLPILLQIPVFIALFTVLRSAVELRYAPFLWISDLSQPERLFANIIPLGLNIWPILMAITMGVQSWLQPGTGDPAQKKMMTWMMPIMMLVMFYNMPSALCLYWTISQVLSIIQMLWIQKRAAAAQA